MMRHRTIALIAALAVTAAACDEPLDVDPRASIPAEEAYDEPVELEIAVMGLYDGLQQADGSYARNTVVFPDLAADVLDFTGTYTSDRDVDQNNIPAENVAIQEIWQEYYNVIGRANNVIAAAPGLEDEVGSGQVAEWVAHAQFIRGLMYFNLVRFYGGVPLVLEPTWSLEGDHQPARASEAEVYAQIEADLTAAAPVLDAGGSSYTANRYAADMLLAKAYLELGRCTEALPLLDGVIEEGGYRLLDNYADVFGVKDNDELIFAVNFTVNDNNNLAFWFFSPDFGGRWGFAPSVELEFAYEGAERYEASIAYDSYGDPFGIKYSRIAGGDDDVPVLRLADAYLLRAEANVCAGAAAGTVVADINAVRERAGVPLLDAVEVDTEEELIDAIAHERFVELAMEGHRFFDLRRLGIAEDVLGIEASQLLFPIPQRERDVNPNLTQNPGY